MKLAYLLPLALAAVTFTQPEEFACRKQEDKLMECANTLLGDKGGGGSGYHGEFWVRFLLFLHFFLFLHFSDCRF